MAAFGGESSTSVALDRLISRMERDEFDLIAVGRALISDPNGLRRSVPAMPMDSRGSN